MKKLFATGLLAVLLSAPLLAQTNTGRVFRDPFSKKQALRAGTPVSRSPIQVTDPWGNKVRSGDTTPTYNKVPGVGRNNRDSGRLQGSRVPGLNTQPGSRTTTAVDVED